MPASNERRSFVIRDPVHGYLRVAAHERTIIDHAITQRLRNVAQHGLAQLVFPEARTSRFAHSLGAMHLASRFVVSAIENADTQTTRNFFTKFSEEFPVEEGWIELSEVDDLLLREGSLYGSGLLAGRVLFRDKELHAPRFRQMLGLIEAGVRLAGLFHDLGHLPFSHDLEFALQDFVRTRVHETSKEISGLKILVGYQPHERIGHGLAELVLTSLVKDVPAVERAVYKLAHEILRAEPPYTRSDAPATAIEWLHSLVDGEIDADRADYLLRDARALGFEFAHYDVERLVNALVLVQHDRFGFVTAMDEHGLTSVESFIVSRARSTQALVRHHKVAQIGAALRHASSYAFSREICRDFRGDLAAMASPTAEGEDATQLLERFAEYDDAWWLMALREIDKAPPDSLTKACLDVVLRRQPKLVSAWKRAGDLTEKEMAAIRGLDRSRLLVLRSTLAAKGILLVSHQFTPYRKPATGKFEEDSVILIRDAGKRLKQLSSVSPLVRSLFPAWNSEVQIQAFGVGTGATRADIKNEVVSEMKKAVA